MRRREQQQLIEMAVRALQVREIRWALLILVLVVVGVWLLAGRPAFWQPAPVPAPPSAEDSWPDVSPLGTPVSDPGSGQYLFCFWNVENLFDDRDDGRQTKADKPYDQWFAYDHAALRQKLENLCTVLLPLNEGKGPDILAVAEIESARAVELLRRALNQRLKDSNLHYRHLVFVDTSGGRNIAPAVLTRLPVHPSTARLLDKKLRILEVRVEAAGQPLTLLASHWTSRLSDRTGERRAVYADQLYRRVQQLSRSDPQIDLLVCGDFNDNPDDPSVVDHLRATADRDAVIPNRTDPLLFNVFAKLGQQGQGSHYYSGRPYLFDQICVSAGMLDARGWSCDPTTATIVKQMATRQGRPDRFGNENDKRPLSARGASDHFPVTLQLQVVDMP